ncbi:unnamed protein product [Effrenium voratum]|uniref:Uncharacterized protein n=1 Tax=Effrenium voratum TaxID=2562239 RepID=A0AA36IKC6_9DINO|nr:unnamed protein product [Effrenium voratum]CAJ1387977.1 unnamed protein product [Effrenium voratum]CAJ1437761.1 unnamed protein product [Effrenium voratum]
MPNAFQSLDDETYGPQFLHNILVVATKAGWAQQLGQWLFEQKGPRKLGIAAASAASACHAEGEMDLSDLSGLPHGQAVEVLDLEDLDAEDFDIVVAVGQPQLSDAWRSKFIFFPWQAAAEAQQQTEQLMQMIDEAKMRRACGAGTSC